VLLECRLQIKPKVWASWLQHRGGAEAFTPLQAGLLAHLSEYKDVLFARRSIKKARIRHRHSTTCGYVHNPYGGVLLFVDE